MTTDEVLDALGGASHHPFSPLARHSEKSFRSARTLAGRIPAKHSFPIWSNPDSTKRIPFGASNKLAPQHHLDGAPDPPHRRSRQRESHQVESGRLPFGSS